MLTRLLKPCAVATTGLACLLAIGASLPLHGQPPSESGETVVKASEVDDLGDVETVEAAEEIENDVDPRWLRLSSEHQRWLETVRPLITPAERDYFLSITEDYRREAFIDRFWEVRDADPTTRFNETRFRWEEHVDSVPDGIPFDDARAMLYLTHGEPGRWVMPDGREVSRCYSRTEEIEIWFYAGSEVLAERFVVILLKPSAKRPYKYWFPGAPLQARGRGRLPTTNVRELCADEFLPYAMAVIANDIHYTDFLEGLATPESPSEEWLETFASATTEIPEGAPEFEIALEIDFPGRNQNRTAVEGLVTIDPSLLEAREFDGTLFRHLVLYGEIVRHDSLFETFRYRYELPVVEEETVVPLVFTRYLRSGDSLLRVRVEDVFASSYGRIEQVVDVPTAEGRKSIRRGPDSPMFKLLREAHEAGLRGERSLRLIPPGEGRIHVGMTRFETQAVGTFDEVTFMLDDRPILTKTRPPYSVELNLGTLPATRRLRVIGFEEDREVASDEIRLNQGGQRFRVHITEPRPDRTYEESVLARVQVEVPEGKTVATVELFLDEDRIGVLYQEPFVQTILLGGPRLAYVRAVATLEDGSSTEDVVFINAPDFLEEVDVQYVELHPLVVDRDDRPILELGREAFSVFEDGQLQEIRRFEWQRDLPIHAGLMIDTSASMKDSLDLVRDAALTFTRQSILDRDRITLISFESQPHVEVGFTNEVAAVERALEGLDANGSTALYDSLVYTLTYFDGVRGQRTLLLLSDGKDENSTFDFDAALEVARRSGVTIYAIGLAEMARDKASRKILRELADETGGRSYFIEDPSELKGIYQAIEEELRSRYLLTYQSTSSKDESQFRAIEVRVAVPGAEARTMSGYYP